MTNTPRAQEMAAVARPDRGRIEQEIARALEHRADLEAQRIHVVVEGGIVTLRGMLPSYRERHLALEAAARAPGVKTIIDQMTVDPLS